MTFKSFIKSFWIFIIIFIGCIYEFIQYNSYSSLFNGILILLFFVILFLIKKEKTRRIFVGCTLVLLSIGNIIEQYLADKLNIIHSIITIAFLMISLLYLMPKGMKKYKELGSKSLIQEIAMFLIAIYVSVQFITKGPNDYFEIFIMLVSGSFALVLGWFLFDRSK